MSRKFENACAFSGLLWLADDLRHTSRHQCSRTSLSRCSKIQEGWEKNVDRIPQESRKGQREGMKIDLRKTQQERISRPCNELDSLVPLPALFPSSLNPPASGSSVCPSTTPHPQPFWCGRLWRKVAFGLKQDPWRVYWKWPRSLNFMLLITS